MTNVTDGKLMHDDDFSHRKPIFDFDGTLPHLTDAIRQGWDLFSNIPECEVRVYEDYIQTGGPALPDDSTPDYNIMAIEPTDEVWVERVSRVYHWLFSKLPKDVRMDAIGVDMEIDRMLAGKSYDPARKVLAYLQSKHRLPGALFNEPIPVIAATIFAPVRTPLIKFVTLTSILTNIPVDELKVLSPSEPTDGVSQFIVTTTRSKPMEPWVITLGDGEIEGAVGRTPWKRISMSKSRALGDGVVVEPGKEESR